MRSVPFEFVSGLAAEFGAVECCWRESDRSFTGFVAEVWFSSLPGEFAARWSAVAGYSVLVRCVSSGPGRFAVSVPVTVPGAALRCEACPCLPVFERLVQEQIRCTHYTGQEK